jgi:transposase-like protein
VTRSVFSASHFNDEAAAYAFVEARLWANGRPCPHCGVVDRSGALNAKGDRIGLYKCYACRKPFTVKIGAIFEKSHIQMRDWLYAIHMICSSKKAVSANQLHRTLGITLKSAWFLAHRIREAMRSGALAPMGGPGTIVEIDETFIGNKSDMPKRRGFAHKHAVLSLVERGGKVRSFHVEGTSAAHLVPILRANIAKETAIMTDEAGQYAHLGKEFASHEYVNHSAGEYGRGDIHTNTLEGFYSIFKRGMKGVYQHCSEKHLHRYVAEFDFRYNERKGLGIDDVGRAKIALMGAKGKRLTYRSANWNLTTYEAREGTCGMGPEFSLFVGHFVLKANIGCPAEQT